MHTISFMLAGRPHAQAVAVYLSQCASLQGVNIDSIAIAEGVCRRTIQHRLAVEGITFRQLIDTERKHRATQLLNRNPHADSSGILRACGFSSNRQATKNFSRWFGITLRAHKARAR